MAVTGGSRFNGLTPARILETRNGFSAPAAKVGANTPIAIDVTDTLGSGVPAGTTAVVLNTTVTEPTGSAISRSIHRTPHSRWLRT